MDPADEFNSPYVYVGNNPVVFIDPDGAQAASGGSYKPGTNELKDIFVDAYAKDTYIYLGLEFAFAKTLVGAFINFGVAFNTRTQNFHYYTNQGFTIGYGHSAVVQLGLVKTDQLTPNGLDLNMTSPFDFELYSGKYGGLNFTLSSFPFSDRQRPSIIGGNYSYGSNEGIMGSFVVSGFHTKGHKKPIMLNNPIPIIPKGK